MALYIERQLSQVLVEAIRYFPVLAITGPRQSGKSTLIKHTFPDYAYFSMEDLNFRIFAMQDPVRFLHSDNPKMIIDEVQRVPELLSYIQGVVDQDESRKFILSGSANFSLLKSVTQSLAGRSGVYELMPMSYAETTAIQEDKSIDQLIFEGMYPAICSKKNKAEFFYRSYVLTYLERDVRDFLQVQNLDLFGKFLQMCAARIGSVFHVSDISNALGVDFKTIKSWLSVLQASYVVYMLPPYFENTDKRLVKSPKLYFCDTGLACYLLGIDSPAVLARDRMRGHLFENFIVMETLKSQFNAGKDANLFFYRDSNQNEIDLLLRRGTGFWGIEVKSSQTFNPNFLGILKRMESYVKQPVLGRAVVYSGDYENNTSDIKILNYRNLWTIL